MAPFEEQFVRPMDDEDVKRLLGLAIRRISGFDIDKHERPHDILKGIRGKSKLRNLTKATIDYLDKLHKSTLRHIRVEPKSVSLDKLINDRLPARTSRLARQENRILRHFGEGKDVQSR